MDLTVISFSISQMKWKISREKCLIYHGKVYSIGKNIYLKQYEKFHCSEWNELPSGLLVKVFYQNAGNLPHFR